jgi:hypothetical protein
MNTAPHRIHITPNYLEAAMPDIKTLLQDHHLEMKGVESETWVDPYEGEQFDYVIELAESVSTHEAAKLSAELEHRLDYSLPINVTIRFRPHD